MTGRRREGLAPNLFPFLAVLICTLGTLILLLALVAQNAGEAFAAATPAAPSAEEEEKLRQMAEADAEIDRRLSEATWRREQVVRIRDEQTNEIDERRTRQAHLEDHVRRLREELKRLEAEVQATQDETAKAELSQEAIDAMKAKIEDEKALIDKLKEDQQTMTPRIVIVPHKGPNGTDRRPIYIECRANGVYLQPGDVAIDPKYLDNDIPGPNPLDAALKTIRLYAMKNYGDVDAPYPLIVVRPDGIETYAAARFAMKDWDDQYGYELVPDEVKLAYPEPDPVMNDQVEVAIAQAVRQQQLYASGGGGGGRGGRGGRGTHGGGGYGNSASGIASSDSSSSAGTETTASGDADAQSPTRNPGSRRAADLPILSARNMDAEMAAALESGTRGNGTGRSSRSQFAAQQAANGASAQAAANEAKLAAEAMSLRGPQTGNSPDSQEVIGSGKLEDNKTPSDAGLNGASTNTAGTSNLGDASNPDDNLAPPNTDNSASSTTTADRFAPPSDVASKSKTPSASTDPNAPIGGSQASGIASNNNPAGTEPPPTDPNSPENDPQKGTPTPAVSMQMNGQKPPKAMVKRGSNNWALPPDVASMIGTSMVRTIRVECHDDRLVLFPEGGKGATHVYGFTDGDIDRASLELATAIRDRVERWGAAMPGGRWQPLLEVNVVPGGELRFQQLRRLMAGSGVNIEAKGSPQ